MDLLALPSDPAFPLAPTPFVCDDDDPDVWDCGTFLTFPRRANYAACIPNLVQALFETEFSPSVTYEWRAGSRDLENVFQGWLFFGLMAEFLSLNKREDGTRRVGEEEARREVRDLVRECTVDGEGDGDGNGKGGKVVIGRPFLRYREKIVERLRLEGGREEQIARALHLSRCLNFARAMVRFAEMGLRESVRYAVAALGQTLVYTLHKACRALHLNIALEKGIWGSWAVKLVQSASPLWDGMIRAGWCPGDLARFQHEFGYLSALHYAGRLKLPPSRFTHEACNSSGCVAAQIRLSEYRLTHVSDDCTCELWEADQDQITDVLSADESTYPVLRIVNGGSPGQVDVTVESRKADVSFVAISHVWADGLGNPFANALQSCQLLKLANLVAALEKSNREDSAEPDRMEYRIWLDTICCPVGREGKKLALHKMADVYREATHVLVLDSALECQRFDSMSGPERYLRLFATSSWVKRLWTLQEAALGSSLFFQFAERAVSVVELRLLVTHDESEDDLGNLCQCARELFDGLQVRVVQRLDDLKRNDPLLSRTLAQLQHGIRYRSVSVPSDEALCITTLLGLDPQPVLEFDDIEDRMKMVWHLTTQKFGGFPADSVFFMGYDTLNTPGWRWAPRTLLQSGSDATWTLFDRLYGHRSAQLGTVVPQGLEVCFPGWRVKLQPWTSAIRIDVWEHLAFRPRYAIVVRDATTGQLMTIIFDFHGLPKTLPEMSIRHLLASPGEYAILRSTALPTTRHLLSRIRQSGKPDESGLPENAAIPVEFVAHVLVHDLPSTAASFYEHVIALARKAASHESSVHLSSNYTRDSSIDTPAAEVVKQYMKQMTAERVEESEELRHLASQLLDKGESLDTLWQAIPITCPFQAEVERLPDTQRWIID